MKKSYSPSRRLLFSISHLLILSLFLLAACTSATQEPALPESLPTLASTEIQATDTLSVPTELPTEVLTDTPETLVTETPLPEPTVDPTALTEGAGDLQVAWVNASTDIVLWRASDQSLTTLVGAAGAIDVRLSGDGTLVAYRRDSDIGQQELWVVNTDGTNARMLLSVEAMRAFDPAALGVMVYQYEWIPGTHTLAFNTFQYVEAPGLFLYDDLHYLDADSASLTTILTPGTGGDFVFSPDGQQLALISQDFEGEVGTISLLNANGTNVRADVLAYPYVLTYSEYNYYADPVWSPDSTFLRVAIPPPDSLGDPTAPTRLLEIPTDGSPGFQIGEVNTQPFFIDPVQFSPDLSQIAYTRLPDPNDFVKAELVIANADGSDEVVYAAGNLFFISWVPDSQHFVFENGELQETYLGILGSGFSLLTDVPYLWDVTWVDQSRFLFSSQTDTGWQFRLGTLGAGSTVIVEQPERTPLFDFDN